MLGLENSRDFYHLGGVVVFKVFFLSKSLKDADLGQRHPQKELENLEMRQLSVMVKGCLCGLGSSRLKWVGEEWGGASYRKGEVALDMGHSLLFLLACACKCLCVSGLAIRLPALENSPLLRHSPLTQRRPPDPEEW